LKTFMGKGAENAWRNIATGQGCGCNQTNESANSAGFLRNKKAGWEIPAGR